MEMSDAYSVASRAAMSRRQPRRTFARLTCFDLACPNCGTLDCVSAQRPWWKSKTNFDPWRSRWRSVEPSLRPSGER